MNIAELTQHPELLNKETLYDLRSYIAQYPYHQAARLLMLQNLYLLHDSTFDEELRRAAIYITDRKVLFNLVEAAHYKIKHTENTVQKGNRTVSLIDNFLSTIPEDDSGNDADKEDAPKDHRKLTAADAMDYVSYLLSADFDVVDDSSEMKGQNLIDDFITKDGGRINLKEDIEYMPENTPSHDEDGKTGDEEYFTETLAGIYIKQGNYSKALEIIKRINLDYPKKNAYFADQIRFLEKLIINSEYSKKVKTASKS